jgi:hypothetical protein
VQGEAPSASDAKDLRFASAANFIAGALMIPWGILIALLGAGGARAAWGQGDALGGKVALLVGAVGLALLWGAATLHLIVGRCLRRRRAHRLALVSAAITAFNPTCVPVGLGVAVLTWHVLKRPSVRAAFDVGAP